MLGNELMVSSIAGFPNILRAAAKLKNRRLLGVMSASLPEAPVVSPWKPKWRHLHLDNYKTEPPESYWSKWPVCGVESLLKNKSWISPGVFLELAEKARYGDKDTIQWVHRQLSEGARLGVCGSARLPSRLENYPSCVQLGDQLTDTLASWVQQRLVCGPVSEEELSRVWKDGWKCSPLSVVEKPSGAGRIIVDMSAPRLPVVDLSSSIPSSQNSGIDVSLFPTGGSSTRDVLVALERVGIGSFMSKQDWSGRQEL